MRCTQKVRNQPLLLLQHGCCSCRGLQRSGVGLPLCSSRACLPTAFIAISVHCVFDWPANVALAQGSPPPSG